MAGEQFIDPFRAVAFLLFDKAEFEHTTLLLFCVLTLFSVYLLWFVVANFLTPKRLADKGSGFQINWIAHGEEVLKPEPDNIAATRPRWMRPFHWLRKLVYYLFIAIRPTKIHFAIATTVIIGYLGLFALHYFFTRPYVIYQNPSADTPWTNQMQPLEIVFDKPVNVASLELHISPEIPGRIEWEPSFKLIPGFVFTRKLKYYPEENLMPEQPIIVYLVNITNLTGTDGIHEASIELLPPVLPEVSAFSIMPDQKDVLPDSDLDVFFTAANDSFVDWDFEVSPRVDFDVVKVNPEYWKLTFPEGLQQSTSYTIKTKRSLREINLFTGDIIKQFEYEPLGSLSFDTVKTPLIKEFAPQGKSVLPASNLIVEFDLPMQKQSVEDNFKITPQVAGVFDWKSESRLEYKIEESLSKDTDYKITIEGDAASVNGGKIGSRVKHEFKTVGKAQVLSLTPTNNTSGLSTLSQVKVTFDQPIDKASAQSKLSVAPSVAGTFRWEGDNVMIFKPNSRFAYSTTYTVSVNSGVKTIHGLDSSDTFTTRFTTAPEQFLLNVPSYRQEETYTCNISATRMALAYKGVSVSESQIKSGIGVGPSLSGGSGGNPNTQWVGGYGVNWGPVSTYIRRYRQTAIRQNWNISDMLQEVRNGNPVILWWQNGSGAWYWKSWTTPQGASITGLNGMHSEVVIGWRGDISNPDTIITRDPWRGTRYYSRTNFDNQWKNSFNRTAVVVY